MGSAVVLLVVAGRLLVPLLIPRFPVPAIIAALVLDAVDQTIFQQVPGLDISGYQSYDKALDVYYLAIAYLSTVQNWSDPFAFGIARFLFYYRLVGVVAFEFSDSRWLLLVFPNTFEYFFIAYEVIRCRWSPTRLRRRALVSMAVGIWVIVKLPQEWWLHIAELDVTDELKTRVFGADLDDSWTTAIAGRPWILPVVAVIVVLLVVAGRRGARHLPAGDWPFGFTVSARTRGGNVGTVPATVRATQSAFLRGPLIEKIVLVSMLLLIFAQILPGVRASNTQIVVTTAILIVSNSVVSHWIAGRGAEWTSTVSQFIAVSAINAGVVVALVLLPTPGGASIQPVPALFFLLLISLIVTLYDRYRMLRVLRQGKPFPIWILRRRLIERARASVSSGSGSPSASRSPGSRSSRP